MEILIVDSSIQIIERLGELISEEENIKTIYRAVSYKAASELFNETKPDVVLLDIGLPQNKSVDLLKEIKAANNKTVVIVLSIHVDEGTKQKYKSLGIDFFFDKYNDFEKIPAVINNVSKSKKEVN